MNDKKERVYSEEDLCEYTILQKIDELEKQLKNIKNEFNGMYETKEAADSIHRLLRSNDAKINNRIDGLYNITPTDVGVKDNKLGLLHDTTWLTNQGAINIGDGLSYDEATKTLKASGGGGGTHLYSIVVNSGTGDKFYYIAASTNDYKISKSGKFVLNFATNTTYADLWELDKKYAASGFYYKNDEMCQVYGFQTIDFSYPYKINVFIPSTKTGEEILVQSLAATIYQIS